MGGHVETLGARQWPATRKDFYIRKYGDTRRSPFSASSSRKYIEESKVSLPCYTTAYGTIYTGRLSFWLGSARARMCVYTYTASAAAVARTGVVWVWNENNYRACAFEDDDDDMRVFLISEHLYIDTRILCSMHCFCKYILTHVYNTTHI